MNAINTGDTAFVLISAALVMFMTPGLALFYGGMVRQKERAGNHHAQLYYPGPGHRGMGPLGLQQRLRP